MPSNKRVPTIGIDTEWAGYMALPDQDVTMMRTNVSARAEQAHIGANTIPSDTAAAFQRWL
jgi:hypothetical protein